MFLIVGTIPEDDFPLMFGEFSVGDGKIRIDDREFPVNRGTASLAASAWVTSRALSSDLPHGLFIGDKGDGKGSRELYRWLIENLKKLNPQQIVFHYLQPDIDYHNRILREIEELEERPVLVADAGYMYVAKMSGKASRYDLFTPDIGELAFLADENAPHPFYTRGFLINDDIDVAEKINRAYMHRNASKTLLVKGAVDFIAVDGEIIETVDYPNVEFLEPIGGTGDTITGIVSALIYYGHSIPQAATNACRINRLAGEMACPTPATQVNEIIRKIPESVLIICSD